jgi:(4-(4-[2-(gamma-L-glutamylamino)ethyl]phenoxymethyl)furan-2-yl)methanamine synthase
MPDHDLIGWDVGGAHLKACLTRRGQVIDVAQWACPLWQGMDHLERALQGARARWPGLGHAHHAVTMTGEMVDLFADREDGVQRIARHLADALQPAADGALRFFAGDAGWCGAGEVARHWQHIASANWLATARHAARHFKHGILVDIGSTTTDLIAFADGCVASPSRTDAERLATGELVYHGVVRTPLCAFGPRIGWRGRMLNVMNEFFATAADVYRLTGELDPAYDLHPSADNAGKDELATRRRLARMIGLDEREATPAEWLAFARAWRSLQVHELASQLRRVMAAQTAGADAVIVGAGCGAFLVADVVDLATEPGTPAPRRLDYGIDVARVSPESRADPAALAAWARVCAPCVAVACLLHEEMG